jgi:predicted GNAT superfamily acetyltransferase
VTDAWNQARTAADAAATVVRSASDLDDYVEIAELLDDTWGRGTGPDSSFIQAVAHAGNTVLVAERDGETIGALVGVLGWDSGLHVHSHVAAVRPSSRGGVGFALKLAQRALALDHGVNEVRWTYDPLIRRNAHLNLEKLGATVRAYLPDFYGVLDDAISGSDSSDRFEVSWRLDSPAVAEAIERSLAHTAPIHTDLGMPPRSIRFELHPDYETLRRDDPDAAAEFRAASRTVFEPAFAEGLPVTFVDRGYVFG